MISYKQCLVLQVVTISSLDDMKQLLSKLGATLQLEDEPKYGKCIHAA